ncbi:lipopolysaccharide biosynthesis protein, partial [Candidatus Bipolaricaulota bacterium]|nr:lipopolysaccharide biosynthesis protein [Candidatus Bipolaricaulota bacterium]
MRLKHRLEQWKPKTSFGKGVLTLTQGTAAGQVLVLAVSPLLTRLYAADGFGAFGVFSSLLGIITVVASLRYQLAIPIPKEDREANILVALSFAILLIISALVAVLVLVASDWIVEITNVPAIRTSLWLLPIAVALIGSRQVLTYWALRQKLYIGMGRARMVQGGARAAAQVLLGTGSAGAGGLMGGYVFGQVCAGAALVFGLRRRKRANLAGVTFKQVWKTAREYRRFPLFSSWSALFNTLSSQLPFLLLASSFGLIVAGFYSLTRQVLGAPLQLVGQSIAQAYLSEAPEAARNGSIGRLTLSIFNRLVKVSVPACLLLAIAAPEIFSVVFGAEWRTAGVYCQWLTPWLFFVFVSSPLSMLPSIMEKQRSEMIFHASLLVFRVAAILIGSALGSVTWALSLFAGIGAVHWGLFMIWNLKLTGNHVVDALGVLGREVVAVVPFLIPLVVCRVFFHQDLYVVSVAGLTGGVLGLRLLLNRG